MSARDAELTQAEIRVAEKHIKHALQPRGIPFYSPEERWVLAILAANYSQLQGIRGKRGRAAAKAKAEYRKNRVNLMLRYVVAKKYREQPNSAATVMAIINLLDENGTEASEPQVRRDIHAALKLGPLPT